MSFDDLLNEAKWPKLKPYVGMLVLYREAESEAPTPAGTNGTRFHPAMVTRVWSETCVNLRVFKDADSVDVVRTSVVEAPALPEGVVDTNPNSAWIWPDLGVAYNEF